MSLISIELPFPHKALWPNGRAHWGARAREFKKHKEWARVAAIAAGSKNLGGVSFIRLVVHPKTKHPIDRDNVVGSAKAYLDGIALAVGVNDSTFPAPVVSFEEPLKGGMMRVILA